MIGKGMPRGIGKLNMTTSRVSGENYVQSIQESLPRCLWRTAGSSKLIRLGEIENHTDCPSAKKVRRNFSVVLPHTQRRVHVGELVEQQREAYLDRFPQC